MPASRARRRARGAVRRSLLWPSVWAAVGFVLLIGLGTWQVQRLHWKEGLIAARQASFQLPPAPPPPSLAAAQRLEYHAVRAAGRFLNDREMPVAAIAADGAAGYDIVTPFALDNGKVLLVDRGFVPTALKAPDTRRAGEIQGPTTVTGPLRLDLGRPSWFTPDNQPARNEWYFIDVGAMAVTVAPHVDVLPYYIDADATPNPGGWPKGGQTAIDLPNHHLSYAITWYALAAGLVQIYAIFIRRQLKERA
ncbi:MAG: SURF1 family protein [Alphaproteobacteria bacterium]|nr:SURF1 family protein [Alphaproteobacteria bacterium]